MKKITVIGLGAGNLEQMPIGVWNRLKQASHIYLRTEKHPVVQDLKDQGILFHSFDHLYEKEGSFHDVYEQITKLLIEKANEETAILYVVPGHPMVAEKTTQLLLQEGPAQGVDVEVTGGQSFLDAAFTALRVDPVEGFSLLDASSLQRDHLNPHLHLLITQVYDQLTASDAKLSLMEVFPDDYEIILLYSAGVSGEEAAHKIPLYELDHHFKKVHNLALIYVPPTREEKILNRQFTTLRDIIAILRGPEGCPWDKEQTHQSIRKNLIEETYEVAEAIDLEEPDALCEELGDLLMQVMLHGQIAEDEGDFNVEDIIQVLNEKLIRRHPHVFGEREAETSQEVVKNWEEIKAQEKRDKGIDPTKQSLLSGVPKDLPALMTAYKLSKKAAKVGFDWDQLQDVYAKIEEELSEVKEAKGSEEIKEELGDLLFAVANLARFLKIDAEEALALTNLKFKRRFHFIEEHLQKPLEEATLDEMEWLWQEAKKKEREA
ncbi:nucleoside triphosphate pyrophosphohydrolase [Ammoniphilus resinae]|uniref:Tetrapyrrole methylase family protein/MazG family protein n=1 Tax=Ammoniphilus resinae TaxID=861532 RepID=A0ABS4GQD1_9BACL|nr:nucleoside triphosphate pyrophosphohydrolase [Ammoniphilus resinae]MBP1932473.1 tetrapyrrole methylase family protein/MazG family protein [Ammoniphilus resinae]